MGLVPPDQPRPTGVAGAGPESAGRGRRWDERGLTTLEWLLILAAVAGLAAVAVVVVQGAVEDTSEAIAAENPRITAAALEASSLTERARAELSPVGADNDAALVGTLNATYNEKCTKLAIVHGSLGLDFLWHSAEVGKPRPTGTAPAALCETVHS